MRNSKIDFVTGTSDTYFQVGRSVDINGDESISFGSSYSTDGGNNWIDLDNIGTDPVIPYSVKFYSGTSGYCIGKYVNQSSNVIVPGTNQVQPKFFRLTDTQQRLIGASLAKTTFFENKNLISPNPSSGTMKIVGESISEITFVDVLGKVVFTEKYNDLKEVNLNIEKLYNGMYLATIYFKDGSSSSQKIIKN